MPDSAPGPATRLRIGFAGTPEFASAALEALVHAKFKVDLVLSQPDRPAGRGMKLRASPVKQLAQAHNIAVFQPLSLRKGEDAQAALHAIKTAADGEPIDVLIVAAYGLILPQVVLDAPRLGCLNIHASLLPRWRGAAPIHRAIEAGDDTTGVCIMQMEAGLDTGPVRLTRRLSIEPTDTVTTLHDKLANLGGQAIVDALVQLARGDLPMEPQATNGVAYAEKIQKSEGVIDWGQSALSLQRRLRAFDPFPGGVTQFGDVALKCFDPVLLCASAGAVNSGEPGEVLSVGAEGVVIQTGQGGLLIRTFQKAGAKRASAKQVADSLGLEPGSRFGV